jgi:DNA polymerase-3 subunit epsilon
MRTLAIIDTETQGLDPSKDACIEVACVLYDIEHAAPIESYASLIRAKGNAAEAVNRIAPGLLESAPADVGVWSVVRAMIERADVVIAHRASFDRSFLPAELRELRPFCCSKFDIEWPHGKLGDHLVHLALAHGVGVMEAHRALTDCETIVRLFQRVAAMGTDVPAMLARAMRPKVTVIAQVSYDDREKAKSAGFAWDASGKFWHRSMAREDVAALPFTTREARPLPTETRGAVTPPNHLLISSTRVEEGHHDRVTVWNRGGNAGTLTVQKGDGAAVAARLMYGGELRAVLEEMLDCGGARGTWDAGRHLACVERAEALLVKKTEGT